MRHIPNSLSPAARFLARHSAAIALALFAAVDGFVFDDYAAAYDEAFQRDNGNASFNYISGDEDALPEDVNRFYGVAFELPLTAVERALGLSDSRDVYLSRRLILTCSF